MNYNKFKMGSNFNRFKQTLIELPEKIQTEILDRVGKPPSNLDDELMPQFISSRIERAYWYYIDEHLHKSRTNDYDRRAFTEFVFNKLNLNKDFISKIHTYVNESKRLPRYGAILIAADKRSVLLVRGFSGQWSFPKGKLDIDDNNDTLRCAIREIYEELKFDVGQIISKDEYYEKYVRPKKGDASLVGLYVVRNVDKNQRFRYDQKEIKEIKWFEINELARLVDEDEDLKMVLTRANEHCCQYGYYKDNSLVNFAI